jgi:thiol-disulfide isomerase/thioredoxin
MKIVQFVVWALASFCWVQFVESAASSKTFELTESNFNENVDVKNEDSWFITFYAPWCSHCKKLYPVLDQLVDYLDEKKKDNSNYPLINVAKIDGTKAKLTAADFGIDKYPRILYKKGNLTGIYDGPRSLDGFIVFLERFNDPVIQEVTVTSNGLFQLSSIHPYHNVTFVLQLFCGGTDKPCSEDTQKVQASFRSVAYQLHLQTSFAVVHHSSAQNKNNNNDQKEFSICKFSSQHIPYNEKNNNNFPLKITQEDELYCLDSHSVLSSAILSQPYASSSEIEKPIKLFIELNNYPFFSIFDNHNFKILSHLNKTMIIAIVDEKKDITTNSILQSCSQQFQQILLQSSSNAEKAAWMAENFILGFLDGNRWKNFVRHHDAYIPSILVIDHQDERHYVMKLLKTAKAHDKYSHQIKELLTNLMIRQNIEMQETIAPGLIQKMIHRFKKYFPWSVILLVLPSLLVIVSIRFPFPKRRKAKET